jgi:lysophospholipase L1-like esterase
MKIVKITKFLCFFVSVFVLAVETFGQAYVLSTIHTNLISAIKSTNVFELNRALGNSVNLGLVPASSRVEPTVSGLNNGPTTGVVFINDGNSARVRWNLPKVEAVRFGFGSTNDVAEFVIFNYRNGKVIQRTENLASYITPNAVNTLYLTTPLLNVKAGDYVGAFCRITGAYAPRFAFVSTTNLTIRAVTATNLTDSPFGSNDVLFNNQTYPIQFLGQPPDVVFFGDSIIGGVSSSYSLFEHTLNAWTGQDITQGYAELVTENRGVNGTTSSGVLGFLVNYGQVNVVGIGTNDMPPNQGDVATAKTTFTNNVAQILSQVDAVVIGILPRNDWCTSTTYWASQARRDWNNTVSNMIVASFPRSRFVSPDAIMGENYPDGDSGNLDRLKTGYASGDGIHLTASGQKALSDMVRPYVLAMYKGRESVPKYLSTDYIPLGSIGAVGNVLYQKTTNGTVERIAQGTKVSVNNGAATEIRPKLNFVAGANMTLSAAQQADAIDVTISTLATVGTNILYVVNTIADVPNVARTNGIPLFVQTLGFGAAGDRGGALYQWVNSTAATNIYRIAANGGGRWIEVDYLQRNFCNVIKAGATPFDTTDDAVAIQRAFDAAAQQSTGAGLANIGDEPTIYFPSGKYYVQSTVSYGPASRGHANITIRGDGLANTFIYRNTSGNTPVFYFQNTRLDISDLWIRGPASTVPPDYISCTGIHLKDCDYGVMDRVKFTHLSRGLVIDNWSMNWNTYRGLQFENCYINIFSAAGGGSTVELHSTTSGHVWFGPASGALIDGHYEASGTYSEFIPAGIWLPAASDTHVRMGYNEASGWFSWLGVPLTNRVTMSVANQTNVTLTFTNGHYYGTGYTFTLIPETTVPSDIANAIAGTLTVSSGNRTNNYVQFNAASPITSDPSGYTFLMKTEYNMGVRNTTITGRGMDVYANAKHTFVDLGANIQIFGQWAQHSKTTERSVNVRASGVTSYYDLFNSVSVRELVYPRHAINIFPDPTFKAGTNWISGLNFIGATCTVVPTNINGVNGLLYYLTAKPPGLYAQYRAEFNPTVPITSLAGKRLTLVAEMWELNYPNYVPTAFSIDSGGSGYVDGTATVSHGGRTVEVTLTTSAGAITAAAWRFGAFVTNASSVIGSLSVVQGSATGGVITPTAFTDRSAGTYAKNGTVRNLGLTLRYKGDSVPGTFGEPTVKWPRYVDKDNVVRGTGWSIRSSPVDGSKTGLRLDFSDDGLNSTYATGCEAIFVPYVAVLVEPDYQNMDRYATKELTQNWNETLLTLKGSPGGANWPGVSPANTASIFAQTLTGQQPGIRIINPNGVAGWIFHLLPDATSDPANASPGAIYFNTSSSVWRVFTGTAWRNW